MVDREPMKEAKPSDERWLEEVSRAYGKTPLPDAASRQRLLDSVRTARKPTRTPPGLAWLFEPLDLRVSPLAAGMAGAVLVIAGTLIGFALRPSNPRETPHPTGQVVEFVLLAPRASQVSLAGDFNEWRPDVTPMHRVQTAGGGQEVWTVAVPVPAGRHIYAFVIDGKDWVADPSAPLAPDDGFGRKASVLVVGGLRST